MHNTPSSSYAPIVSFEEFATIRAENDLGTIVCTSGGYDPVHPGHLSNIIESSKMGDTMVVIVNGDTFLTNKKGKPFQDITTRCQIISCMKGVDYVIPFEIENDQTVREALRQLRPHIFTKGGDRVDHTSIPEWSVCEEMGIEIRSGVGFDKLWSSSDFLKEWEEHTKKR